MQSCTFTVDSSCHKTSGSGFNTLGSEESTVSELTDLRVLGQLGLWKDLVTHCRMTKASGAGRVDALPTLVKHLAMHQHSARGAGYQSTPGHIVPGPLSPCWVCTAGGRVTSRLCPGHQCSHLCSAPAPSPHLTGTAVTLSVLSVPGSAASLVHSTDRGTGAQHMQ